MADPDDGTSGDDPRDGATEAIGAWADGRIAAGEAAPERDPRPVAEATVELREVTAETVRAVCLLHVAPDQRGFVAPNAVSFAEAMFEPKAWFRAVVADDVPVGFVMLSVDEAAPEYYLWRFMIDQRYQGRGYGRAAIAQRHRARADAAERDRAAGQLGPGARRPGTVLPGSGLRADRRGRWRRGGRPARAVRLRTLALLVAVGTALAACGVLAGSRVVVHNESSEPIAIHANGAWIGTVAPGTVAELPFHVDDGTTSVQGRTATGATVVDISGTRAMIEAALDGSMPMSAWQDLECGRIILALGPFDPSILEPRPAPAGPCP